MKCPTCGNEFEGNFCPNCGCSMAQNGNPSNDNWNQNTQQQNSGGLRCPKCGSTNISVQLVTETYGKSKTKGFGWIKSCLGFLLFSIPGILCGLCGMGKGKSKVTSTTRSVNVCQNCGNQF